MLLQVVRTASIRQVLKQFYSSKVATLPICIDPNTIVALEVIRLSCLVGRLLGGHLEASIPSGAHSWNQPTQTSVMHAANV